ncbi:unnamed protein product, partial [Ixodes hexagonus]
LTSTLNRRADPCDDFGGYVCSALRPTGDDLTWNLKYNTRYLWAKMKAEYLARNVFKAASMIDAANTFDSCANRSGQNESGNLAAFVSFMKQRRLAWPHNLDGRTNPLDVALDLCIRWELPLWFNIRLLPKTPSNPRRLYFTPTIYTSFWVSHYKELAKSGRYKNYIENYMNLFDLQFFLNATYVKNELDVTMDVLASIHNGAFRKRKNATMVPIEELDKLLPAGKGETWTDLLNKYFRQDPSFSPSEAVLLSDTEILEVIRRLLDKYGPDVMLHQLSWWFVQYYAVLASEVAFTLKYGAKGVADTVKPLFCEIQVEDSHKWALLGDHVTSNLLPTERGYVDSLLNNVIAAAITKIQDSSWIDRNTKAVAIGKLGGMLVNLWPKTLPPATLDGSTRLPTTDSYVKYWIRDHERSASLIGTEDYYERTRLAHNFRDQSFRYDYLLNHVTLAMLTVEEPFHIRNGTAALNYGGLGSAFAREVVKAFDPEGVTHLWSGSRKSWLSNETVAGYTERARCEGKGFQEGLFPEVPGLETVYQAFQEDQRAFHGSFTYGAFSDRQVFFLQYCHVMCRLNKTSLGQGCNLALRNFNPFADAFHCPRGSPMNPTQKCSFF